MLRYRSRNRSSDKHPKADEEPCQKAGKIRTMTQPELHSNLHPMGHRHFWGRYVYWRKRKKGKAIDPCSTYTHLKSDKTEMQKERSLGRNCPESCQGKATVNIKPAKTTLGLEHPVRGWESPSSCSAQQCPQRNLCCTRILPSPKHVAVQAHPARGRGEAGTSHLKEGILGCRESP